MLKSFSATGFRNINLDGLKFKRLNLFVGPNNSGKSNLIDAISFFSNIILSEKKESAFLDELAKRGWDDILDKKIDKPGIIAMKWVLNTDYRYPDITYELRFRVSSSDLISKGFYITNEQLRYNKPTSGQLRPFEFINCHDNYPGKGNFSVRDKGTKKYQRLVFDVSEYDTVFRQMKSLLASDDFRMNYYLNFNQAVQTVKDFFERFFAYSSTRFRLDAVREPVEIETNSQYLNMDGSNFVNVLGYLDEKYNFIDDYTEKVKELIPNLERVKIVFVGERKRSLRLTIDGKVFKLFEMSDGTIKALLLTLLLWTPQQMTMLALDEPELNLHPAWLKVISNWVLRSHSTEQFFISTHSPDFLDAFTSVFQKDIAGLYVFSLKDEHTIKLVPPDVLKESISEGWELGDLYRIGDPLVGGWPW